MRAADAKKLPDGADRIMNKEQTASLIGVSVSTLDRMIRRKKFPQPLQLSPRRVGWPLSLIQAWISRAA
jgi:predicted DNA-binding transcriptional regulator AlpA